MNNPTNAPAAIIASIDASRKILSRYNYMYWCYRYFANLLNLCYIFHIYQSGPPIRLGLVERLLSYALQQTLVPRRT